MHKSIFNFQHLLQTFIFYFSIISFGSHNIHHDRRKDRISISKGVAQYQSPEHIELGTIMRFNGVMTAVVDSWSSFIDKDVAALVYKHFDREDPGRFEIPDSCKSDC